MSTKSRETIFGGRLRGAEIRAKGSREDAIEAVRKADRAEAGVVPPIAGLRRASAAGSYIGTVPQRRQVLS
jgi:hypothetical protein